MYRYQPFQIRFTPEVLLIFKQPEGKPAVVKLGATIELNSSIRPKVIVGEFVLLMARVVPPENPLLFAFIVPINEKVCEAG
ncbi:MAG: hypothetical protein IPN09_07710 [Bacteroidetes bacterium]|nr:hypothetical protein [Bacteroidota bacterium]